MRPLNNLTLNPGQRRPLTHNENQAVASARVAPPTLRSYAKIDTRDAPRLIGACGCHPQSKRPKNVTHEGVTRLRTPLQKIVECV